LKEDNVMTRTLNPRKLAISQLWKLSGPAVLIFLCTGLRAQIPTFVSFDAPDAGTSKNQGTTALFINQNGVISGHYADASGVLHGFVRAANGQITEFDPPGTLDTFVQGINLRGQIVGFAARTTSGGSHEHGFARTPNGQFSGIDFPGAVETLPHSINDNGQITGQYGDSAGTHGFLRDVNGTYTSFDGPGSGTIPVSINSGGVITGYYSSSDNVSHGFVRDSAGNITSFDAPGAAGSGTFASSINSAGEITGTYSDASFSAHSFLRDASGTMTSVDFPGVSQTFAATINDQGAIVGEIVQGSAFTGYRRDSSGNFHAVTVPVPNIAGTVASNFWHGQGVVQPSTVLLRPRHCRIQHPLFGFVQNAERTLPQIAQMQRADRGSH
jgi:hypothetical protein